MVGPCLVKDRRGSVGYIAKILGGDTKGIPNIELGMVDVRDVAQAHLMALKKSDL